MPRMLPMMAALCMVWCGFGQPAMALRVVNYNIVNYSSGRVSELQTIFNAIEADIIVAQEINDLAAAQALLTTVLNASGGPGGYLLATFTANGSLTNNALFYRASRLTHGGTGAHMDVPTDPRDTDRWRLNLVGYTGTQAQLYVYGMHLKAGSSSSDQTDRLLAAVLIRSNANALPDGSHFIMAGDYNIRSSNEDCYALQFTASQADNSGRAFDPISSPGTWNSNPSFALIHTQSPHLNNANPAPGAVGGGMDDRFDFQLVSSALMDGSGLAYVPGTYRTFGNDGNHYNEDINDPPTIPEGIAVANALHGASDHLPVVADYQVPALQSVSPATLVFPDAIMGATASATLTVTNPGNVALFGFVAPLQYSLSAAPPASAPPGTSTSHAGSPGNVHTLTLSSATAGTFNGTVTVSGDGSPASSMVPYSGRLLRPSEPSLAPGSAVINGVADFGNHPAGAFSAQAVTVHNFGYDSLQAPLDVHDALIVGTNASRFSIQGGFQGFFVSAPPQSLSIDFDDSGGTGTYSAILILNTRDPIDLAGGQTQESLLVNLTATVQGGGCPTPFVRGEVNGDSMVDIGDAVYLLTFLFSNGPPAVIAAAADVNSDGTTDIGDAVFLLGFLFSNGPQPAAPFPAPGCP